MRTTSPAVRTSSPIVNAVTNTINTDEPVQADNNRIKTTSSSAISKRPRDASCLSVVSINSTKRPTESFIVSYIRYATDLSLRAILFCCLWRNVETSCNKHFMVVSRHQQTPPLTTSDKCRNCSVDIFYMCFIFLSSRFMFYYITVLV